MAETQKHSIKQTLALNLDLSNLSRNFNPQKCCTGRVEDQIWIFEELFAITKRRV